MTDPASTGGLSQKPTDNPPFTAQWPHKKVWLAKTGHWAEYDDLTIEQFVQGYIEIMLPTIPQGPSTQIGRDHICYLQNMMRDTSSAPWHLVRSSHKQILLMVEHNQLKWENVSTRDAIRAAQLLLAKEEAIQAKFFDLPAKSTKPGNKPQSKEEPIKPCHSFNNGTCTHLKNHVIDGTRMLHICAHFNHQWHGAAHHLLSAALPTLPRTPAGLGSISSSQTRDVFCLQPGAPRTRFHLPGSTSSRNPQLQRSPPAGTTQP